MRGAFFDLDKTLIDVNSASLWLRRELKAGRVTKVEALLGAWWLVLYGLGFARMERAIERAVLTLAGLAEEVVRERTVAFWEEELRARIRAGGRRAIARHRERGEPLVLLTGASVYLAEAAQRELGFDHVICNRMEITGGRFTGRVADSPLCFGYGKLELARRFCSERGVDLAASTFYTDSYSDLPVLEAVADPRVVSPDRRLLRIARRRGWPIELWGGA